MLASVLAAIGDKAPGANGSSSWFSQPVVLIVGAVVVIIGFIMILLLLGFVRLWVQGLLTEQRYSSSQGRGGGPRGIGPPPPISPATRARTSVFAG